MRYYLFILSIIAVGCKKNDNIVAPETDSSVTVSISVDSVLYTIDVQKTSLDIRDTLKATINIYNQSIVTDTIYSLDSAIFWCIMDTSGVVVFTGPSKVISNKRLDRPRPIPLGSHQSIDSLLINRPISGLLQEQGTYKLIVSHLNAGSLSINLSLYKNGCLTGRSPI
jgi:hypothetical protein